MLRRFADAALALVVEAVLAGAIVGIGETIRIVVTRAGTEGGAPGFALSLGLVFAVTALVLAGSPVVGSLAGLVVRGVAALPWIASLRDELREPGERRVAAIARIIVAVAGGAIFAGITFAIASWTHRAFNEPKAIALLEAGLLTAVALVVLLAVATFSRLVPPRLARVEVLRRATRGRLGTAVGAGLAIAAAIAIYVVLHAAAPAADFRPHLTAAGFVVAILVVRGAGVSRRLRRRGHVGAIVLGVVLATAGLMTIGSQATVRGLVSSDGIASRRVLELLWSISDSDGDGYPSRFGGLDCDDGNAAIHPGVREVLGNGRDENCWGGDVTLAAVAQRVQAQPTSYPQSAGTRNVILVSLDAVRADHLGAYGYARRTSPRLDELAARSTRFDWAISPSPTTRRAIPALMTSKYASAAIWQDRKEVRIKIGAQEVMGQSFQHAGFDTVAIHCCTTLFDKPHGVVEGIGKVDATAEKVSRKQKYNADEVAKRVVTFLEGRKTQTKPFFLWLHMIDPHNPYMQLPGSPVFGKKAIDKYDSEIHFVDRQVGVILDALAANGLEGTTIIAVTADHGDEFEEHGNRHHGNHVYNEVMRVPLIVHDPGAPPSVVSAPVSLVDIGPTLLDLAGVGRPAGQNGRSLAPAVREGKPAPDRMVLGELIADYRILRNMIAGYHADWKIIWDLDANTYQLFSLREDPLDQVDRKSRDAARFQELRKRLHETIDRELSQLPPPPAEKSATEKKK